MEKSLSLRDLNQGFTTSAAEFCIIRIEGTAILAKHIYPLVGKKANSLV
jgi:hypothetical protein